MSQKHVESLQLVSKHTGTAPLYFICILLFQRVLACRLYKTYNKAADVWRSHCFLVGSLTQRAMKKQNQKAEDEAILIVC